jgi:hypothetical protein
VLDVGEIVRTLAGHGNPASAARPPGRAPARNDGTPSEPLYRRNEDNPAEPVDLVAADPVVDTETGEEVFVIYKRPKEGDS